MRGYIKENFYIKDFFIFAFCYIFFTSISLYIARLGNDFSLIWFANIVVGLLLSTKKYNKWGISIVGGMVGNFIADVPYSNDLTQSFLFTIPNAIEVVLIAYLAKNEDGIKNAYSSTFNYLKNGFQIVISPVFVSSIVGTIILYAFKGANIASSWSSWFIADVVGGLIFYPATIYIFFEVIKILFQKL